MLHFYARDYDPTVGAWIQQDLYRGRLAEPATLHRYGYVSANPIQYVDQNGYFAHIAGGAAIGGVIGAVAHITVQLATGNEIETQEVLAAAVGGAVQGGICAATALALCNVAGGAAGSAASEIYTQIMVEGRSVTDLNLNSVAAHGAVGAATGLVSGVVAGQVGEIPRYSYPQSWKSSMVLWP